MAISTYSDITSDDEYDSDGPGPLVLDFNELTRRASLAVSRTCTSHRKLTRGTFHEVFILFFNSDETCQDGAESENISDREWSCIARVSREPEMVEKLISEVETMENIRFQTSSPVPEIYAYDFELKNSVGAQFMLMERIPGRNLYQIWDKLTLDHKKTVVSDIAQVLAQLSRLKFDRIGCLSTVGEVGPFVYGTGDCMLLKTTGTNGPFETTLEYLLNFVDARTDGSEVFSEVKAALESYMSIHSNSPVLSGPFRLIHADFDVQNLFTGGTDDGAPPRLSGVIDWEYAYTGPAYFLYEYPIFIQDRDDNKAAYAENAVLRPHFVRMLRQCFPKGSAERTEVEISMKKDYTLNKFSDIFVSMRGGLELQILKMVLAEYVDDVSHGTGKPYGGRFDYVSDEEVLDDD